MLIVGSKALKFHYPNYPRTVRDIDVIGFSKDVEFLSNLLSPKEIVSGDNTIILKGISYKTDVFDTENVEILLADNSVSLKMYLDYDKDSIFASKEVLLSLKKKSYQLSNKI